MIPKPPYSPGQEMLDWGQVDSDLTAYNNSIADHSSGSALPGYGPSAATQFKNPNQTSGWTGVSTAEDPYGIHGVGYDMGQIASGSNAAGTPQYDLNRSDLLRAGGYGNSTSFLSGALPDSMKFSGYSKYENPGGKTSQAPAPAAAGGGTSSYPAMDNSYGLGGSPTGNASAPSQTSYSGQQGLTVNIPDMSSRGFNPWSMVGEANARDNGKGVVQPEGPAL